MNRWTTPWGMILWPHRWIPLQTPFQIRSLPFLVNDFLMMSLTIFRVNWTPLWIVWNKSYLRFPWEGQMPHKPWLQRMADHLCNHLRWRARGLIQGLFPSHLFLPHAVPHVDALELFRHANLIRIWVCQFVQHNCWQSLSPNLHVFCSARLEIVTTIYARLCQVILNNWGSHVYIYFTLHAASPVGLGSRGDIFWWGEFAIGFFPTKQIESDRHERHHGSHQKLQVVFWFKYIWCYPTWIHFFWGGAGWCGLLA